MKKKDLTKLAIMGIATSTLFAAQNAEAAANGASSGHHQFGKIAYGNGCNSKNGYSSERNNNGYNDQDSDEDQGDEEDSSDANNANKKINGGNKCGGNSGCGGIS